MHFNVHRSVQCCSDNINHKSQEQSLILNWLIIVCITFAQYWTKGIKTRHYVIEVTFGLRRHVFIRLPTVYYDIFISHLHVFRHSVDSNLFHGKITNHLFYHAFEFYVIRCHEFSMVIIITIIIIIIDPYCSSGACGHFINGKVLKIG